MHWIQRKHRDSLRRRVASGEVDLEALGIKRLNVPQDILDKMPLYVYNAALPSMSSSVVDQSSSRGPPDSILEEYSRPLNVPALGRRNSDPTHTASIPSSNTSDLPTAPSDIYLPSNSSTVHERYLSFEQPTCAICLEEFIPCSTTVRELPCGHVFHPECVDFFLRENSSLCPMCKKSVLPPGYCPDNITNAMVRRERLVRRMRERVTVEVVEDPATAPPTPLSRPLAIGRRMASFHRQFGRAGAGGRRISSAPTPRTLEMSTAELASPISPSTSPPTAAPRADSTGRREWARLRAVALLGQRVTPEIEESERGEGTPKCEYITWTYLTTALNMKQGAKLSAGSSLVSDDERFHFGNPP